MNEKSIYVERDGPVATVVINRPNQRNAINLEMWSEIKRISIDLDRDENVRAVVFRGAGTEAFSAGADISEFDEHRNSSEQGRAYSAVFDGALDAVWDIGKPVISMIRGFCVGGGLELACCTDLRIAAVGSRFGIPTAKLGVLVGYREMRRLIQLVGTGGVAHILLGARILNGDEALRMGLITSLVPEDQLESTVYKLAHEIAGMSPLIHRWHKQIIRTVLQKPTLDNLTPEEAAVPFACFDSEDFQEGKRAFLEKRRPVFRGK
ncbi:MAG TPA: enoyl-CoA hydratase-related protein [Blastocatellia bacterium]|nr:enoyl-CoA hydratase-related protein [Blastocatellia bacterium]